MPTRVNGSPAPRQLNRRQARELFDERAQRSLGVSGGEFLRRWDAGEYDPTTTAS